MRQPKKLKREQKIEIASLRPDINLEKYRLVSESNTEFILTDSVTNTEHIVIKR